MTTKIEDRSAIAKCCLISARMLEIADDGQVHDHDGLRLIQRANQGQAALLRAAADMADELLAVLKEEWRVLNASPKPSDTEMLAAAKALGAAIAKAEGRS